MSSEDDKSASPVCYARDADPTYMGFASTEELIAFLNEILEAERAIADRLRAMLPKIRDDALHAELNEMLASHEDNIAKTNAMISSSST